jgi:hypothetical protein
MIFCRKVLRSDDSSPENFSPGKFFAGGGKLLAGAFFTRTILRRIILLKLHFYKQADLRQKLFLT